MPAKIIRETSKQDYFSGGSALSLGPCVVTPVPVLSQKRRRTRGHHTRSRHVELEALALNMWALKPPDSAFLPKNQPVSLKGISLDFLFLCCEVSLSVSLSAPLLRDLSPSGAPPFWEEQPAPSCPLLAHS